jgi:plasmid stabilization system protein ParE
MIRKLVVEPEIEADIIEAEAWYRERSRVASVRFSEGVKRTFRLILDNPLQYQLVFRRYRRATIRQFPYALIYSVTDTEIVVVACMHGRRHPRRWQDRARE